MPSKLQNLLWKKDTDTAQDSMSTSSETPGELNSVQGELNFDQKARNAGI